MGSSVAISPLNIFSFRTVKPRADQYHRGHLGDSLQQELLMSFQVGEIWKQPVERGERFYFAFDATDNVSHTLTLVSCQGTVIHTFGPAVTVDIEGNLTTDGTQLHSYMFRRANLENVPAGTYYLLLTVNWAIGQPYRAVSEPIDLRDEHPETVLIEYRHSENKLGMWYEQFPSRPALRIPGFISDMDTLSDSTVFKDQGRNTVPLDDHAYEHWILNVEPVADYMRKKLNEVFTCNYILLDGKQYTKAGDSASWEKEGTTTAPLWAATLMIQAADGYEDNVYSDPRIPLFTIPASTYALISLTITAGALTLQLKPALVPGYINNNLAQTDAMIAALNAARIAQDLFGTVVRDGNVVYYENGSGENFTSGSANISATSFGFTFNSPGPFGSGPGAVYPVLPLTFRRAGGLIDWGDGTLEAIGFSVSTTTISHTYTGPAGAYNVRIFGRTELFAVISPLRSGFTGTLPAGLRSLSIDSGTFPANRFDFAILQPVASTLRSLNITGAGLTAADGFNNVYLPLVNYIDFSGNALPANVVSAFMYDVRWNAQNRAAGSPILTGGVFSIAGQTPPVTMLNATGTYNRDLLRSPTFNWTVQH